METVIRFDRDLFSKDTVVVETIADVLGIDMTDIYALTFSMMELTLSGGMWLDYDEMRDIVFPNNPTKGNLIINIITQSIKTLLPYLPKDIVEIHYLGIHSKGVYIKVITLYE